MRITETTPPAPKPPREFTLVVSVTELRIIHEVLRTARMGYGIFIAINEIVETL